MRKVEAIPEVHDELGCYNWVYISLYFNKGDGVETREEKVVVDPDTDEEDIEDVVLYDERESHWCMVFEDNNGGVDGTKDLLHYKKWYVYNLDKEALVKGGYSVEVSDKYGKKVIWGVVDCHMVE